MAPIRSSRRSRSRRSRILYRWGLRPSVHRDGRVMDPVESTPGRHVYEINHDQEMCCRARQGRRRGIGDSSGDGLAVDANLSQTRLPAGRRGGRSHRSRSARCTFDIDPDHRDLVPRRTPADRRQAWRSGADHAPSGQRGDRDHPSLTDDRSPDAVEYEREMRRLHGELVALHGVKATDVKVLHRFEGRVPPARALTFKCITERVSPRVFRVVALPPRQSERSHRCTSSATCPDLSGRR